jgi:UDP-N-acetylmuramate--alanine ligase
MAASAASETKMRVPCRLITIHIGGLAPLVDSNHTAMDALNWSGRRLHFVGIGGAGMSGLAIVAQSLGAEVTGSDRAESSYTGRLRERGIVPALGHRAENVPEGAEVVYSTAVPATNPERQAAAGRELHRADVLAELSRLKRCLAVTGTHGKTTTAGMIVHALRGCGLDPAYVLGGELRSTGANAAWGSGEWIVVEADESDRSLLKLEPEIALLTNAELDHHSTYASRLDLERTLTEFMARAGDRAIVWDRPGLRALCPPGAVTYDAPEPVLGSAGARFQWRGVEVRLSVPGAHNAINAAGALTAAALAGAEAEAAAAALADFTGARRRFEPLGLTAAGADVYDDYAHHPTEVAAVLAAARTLEPARLVAVFQPHLYSRTQALWREFGAALAAADVVAVLDVYPARERAEDHAGVDGRLVAGAAADAAEGRPVAWVPDFAAARRFLDGTLRSGDLCLLMGAGDIDAFGRSLVG